MARVVAPPDTSALDVAEFLIDLAAAEPEPDYLSPLRLQKLLYYTQAWSLANRGRPLFSEPIEAWDHGPVVRKVYAKYVGHGNKPIEPSGKKIKLSDEDRDFVTSVWEAYKPFSATALRNMTHAEPPWQEAYKGPSSAGRTAGIVSHASMRTFFANR